MNPWKSIKMNAWMSVSDSKERDIPFTIAQWFNCIIQFIQRRYFGLMIHFSTFYLKFLFNCMVYCVVSSRIGECSRASISTLMYSSLPRIRVNVDGWDDSSRFASMIFLYRESSLNLVAVCFKFHWMISDICTTWQMLVDIYYFLRPSSWKLSELKMNLYWKYVTRS